MNVEHGVVLGSPRSGTTFLMSVLNTMPDMECISGTLLPVAVPHVVNQDVSTEVYDALAVGFERALDAYLHSGRFRSRAAAVQKWFRAPTSGLSGLVRALQGVRNVRQIVYKEPFLSLAPRFVLDALPDAKIIHICRDGRDVANSLVRSYDVLSDEKLTHLRGSEMRMGRTYDERYVPWWVEEGRDDEFINSVPYVRAIWMWKAMVRRCHEAFSAAKEQSTDQVMLLRYENFMRDPQTYGRAVVEHLGGKPTAATERRLRRAHVGSIGKYKNRSSEEINAAERIAGDELRLYGYA